MARKKLLVTRGPPRHPMSRTRDAHPRASGAELPAHREKTSDGSEKTRNQTLSLSSFPVSEIAEAGSPDPPANASSRRGAAPSGSRGRRGGGIPRRAGERVLVLVSLLSVSGFGDSGECGSHRLPWRVLRAHYCLTNMSVGVAEEGEGGTPLLLLVTRDAAQTSFFHKLAKRYCILEQFAH